MLLMKTDTVKLIKHVLAPHQSIAFYRSTQLWLKLTHKAARMLFRGIPLGHAADICLWLHWVENYTASVWGIKCTCQTLSSYTGSRLTFCAECVYIQEGLREHELVNYHSWFTLMNNQHQTFLLRLIHTHLTSGPFFLFLIPFFSFFLFLGGLKEI